MMYMCLTHNNSYYLLLVFSVARVSFTQDRYNGIEGMEAEVCAMLSNPIARLASIQLTVDNSVSMFDDAEGIIIMNMFLLLTQLNIA